MTRVLVYNPSYTLDRDPTSLRITMLAGAMAPAGWQFDIVTSPVFFLGDRAFHTKLREVHETRAHLRVFLTHPGIVGTMRYKLHNRKGQPTPVDAGPEGSTLQRSRTGLHRLLRRVHLKYNRLFARIGDPDWILPAIVQGLRQQSARPYGLVYACASSYFASYIAAGIISRLCGLPLVLDYVDPWTSPHGRSGSLDCGLEAWVLRRARRAVVTNERVKAWLLARYRFLRPEQIEIITQGYCEEEHVSARPANDHGTFTVVFTGTFYSHFVSPVEFLKGVRIAAQSGITVTFTRAGRALPTDFAHPVRQLGLGGLMHDVGELPHLDALALQRTAAVLLVIGTTSPDQIPGKTIEYIGARRPLLCLSQGPDDLAARFVEEHGLGVVVPNEADAIAIALGRLHDLWREGRLDVIYRPRNVEAFSWAHLGERLGNVFLNAMVGPEDRHTAPLPRTPRVD